MPDVNLYQGTANPKDVKLRYAGQTEGPPPPAVGYQYSNGLVSIQVG